MNKYIRKIIGMIPLATQVSLWLVFCIYGDFGNFWTIGGTLFFILFAGILYDYEF